jgi:hypothetical protein
LAIALLSARLKLRLFRHLYSHWGATARGPFLQRIAPNIAEVDCARQSERPASVFDVIRTGPRT